MKLISKNAELVGTLTRLIGAYPHMAFAVAWASAGTEVFKLLQENVTKVVSGVIGTHFYQTDPEVLDRFQGSTSIKFVLQPSGVFHPKVYVFWSQEKWELLIGSANLTAGAMRSNSEAMMLIDGADAQSSIKADTLSLIEQYSKDARTVYAADAERYRRIHLSYKREIGQLGGVFGGTASKKPPTDSSVMSMSWGQYLERARNDIIHTFDGRIELLRKIRSEFTEKGSVPFSDMKPEARKLIAGLPTGYDARWGWFGSMKGNGLYSQAINKNTREISNALDHIPLDGPIVKSDYENFIRKFLNAFSKPGIGTASRLLAMKRPDYFFCFNDRNKSRFCENTGAVAGTLIMDNYWDVVVERIMATPWWRSPMPKDADGAEAWMGRAAMLDSIFYEVS